MPGYPATLNGCRPGRRGWAGRRSHRFRCGRELLARWVRFTPAALRPALRLLGGQPRRPCRAAHADQAPAEPTEMRSRPRDPNDPYSRVGQPPGNQRGLFDQRATERRRPGRIAWAPATMASTTGIGGTPRRRCLRRRVVRSRMTTSASRPRRRGGGHRAPAAAQRARSRWPRHSASTPAAVGRAAGRHSRSATARRARRSADGRGLMRCCPGPRSNPRPVSGRPPYSVAVTSRAAGTGRYLTSGSTDRARRSAPARRTCSPR